MSFKGRILFLIILFLVFSTSITTTASSTTSTTTSVMTTATTLTIQIISIFQGHGVPPLYSVAGYLKTKEGGVPIAGKTIYVTVYTAMGKTGSYECTTDTNGYYRIPVMFTDPPKSAAAEFKGDANYGPSAASTTSTTTTTQPTTTSSSTTTTTTPTCDASSTVTLTLSPNPASSGATITPTVSTSSACSGKTARIISGGNSISTCTVGSNGMCTGGTFSAPSSSQNYWTYIDLNGNGLIDGGEPQSSQVTLTITTTTTSSSTTTTTIPSQLNLTCSECTAGSSCTCKLTGTCNSGLWIVKNKEGTPLTAPIISEIPPADVSYNPTNAGKVDVIAICFNPSVTVQRVAVEVKPKFLSCNSLCSANKLCNCTVTGCTSGLFLARNKEGTPLASLIIDDIITSPYTNSFNPTSAGKARVTAVCFAPMKVESTDITVS